MFHNRSLARLVPTAAFAVLALSFAPAALAQEEILFEEEILIDPGAPPSEFPDHSGEMNNFGSRFVFSFSNGGGTGFVPSASIRCSTCTFPVNTETPHTFTLQGKVLGRVVLDSGTEDPFSLAVYSMSIEVRRARATASALVDVGNGQSEQTITYTADLTAPAPFNGAVSGQLVLDEAMTAKFFPLSTVPAGATIKVGAEVGVTAELDTNTGSPTLSFPAISTSDPDGLGQNIPANRVFQVVETKRVRQ